MTGSAINFGAKVIRRKEGLVERRGKRIHLGLEDITLSERSQTSKSHILCCIIIFIQNVWNRQIHKGKNK